MTEKTKLLTPEEVSQIIGITPESLSVWRCTARYQIPYIKIGSRVRYRESDIMNWLNQRTQNKGDEHEDI